MRKNGLIVFCIATTEERDSAYRKRSLSFENHAYTCAGCGKETHGRIVARMPYDDGPKLGGTIYWCLCSCGEPTVIKVETLPHPRTTQSPRGLEYIAGENWPPELSKLFTEASASLSAGAFTGCAMVCRKILMAVACKQGDTDGQSFQHYVDYILQHVVPIASAKPSIDSIRQIGNEANHDIAFVAEPDARRAIGIVRYILNAAYSLPSA